ncbi:MAG: flippase [Pseudomonadota bacterium]
MNEKTDRWWEALLRSLGMPLGGSRAEAAGVALVKVSHAVVAFGISILLARVLGVDAFGRYSFALTVCILLALVAQIGLPPLLLRQTARAKAAGEAPPRRLLRWGLMVGMGLGLSIVAAMLLAISITGLLDPARDDVMAWAVLLVPLTAGQSILAAVIAGSGSAARGHALESVLQVSLTALGFGLVLAVLGTARFGVELAMAINISATALGFAVALWVVHRRGLLARGAPGDQGAPGPRQWLAAAIPLGALGGVQIINANVDMVMLGLLASDRETGIYRVVGQMILALGLLPNAVLLAVRPRYAGLWQQDDRLALQRLVRRSTAASTGLALVLGVGLILVAEPLLALVFGAPFTEGAGPLSVLVAGVVMANAIGPTLTLAGMTGNERVALRIVAIALTGNIVLNALLIPSFGMMGAAASSVASLVFARLWLRHVLRVRLGIEAALLPPIR